MVLHYCLFTKPFNIPLPVLDTIFHFEMTNRSISLFSIWNNCTMEKPEQVIYLWVVKYSVPVVDAASSPGWALPFSMHHGFIPCLPETKH